METNISYIIYILGTLILLTYLLSGTFVFNASLFIMALDNL